MLYICQKTDVSNKSNSSIPLFVKNRMRENKSGLQTRTDGFLYIHFNRKTSEQQKHWSENNKTNADIHRNGLFDSKCHTPDSFYEKMMVKLCFMASQISRSYCYLKKYIAKMTPLLDRNTVHTNARTLSTGKCINK